MTKYKIQKRFRTIDDGSEESYVVTYEVVDTEEDATIGSFMSLELADRKVRSLLKENA